MAASDEIVLGLVVNPKLKKPVLVSARKKYGTAHVSIFRMDQPDWPHVGEGYYGESDDQASSVTGLPRSHTPAGVDPEGEGYGTCLYTALCLGAHQDWEKNEERVSVPRFSIGTYVHGDGISSMEGTRSGAADEWWENAKRRRLAVSQEDETTDEDVDVTSEFRDKIVGEEYDDGTISYVNDIKVDVSKSQQVDAYPFERATRNNLIAADFTIDLNGRAPESLWQILQSGRDDIEIDVQVPWVLALDVRGLTIEAINLLGILAQTAGATEDQLHGLRSRWELQMDPDAEIRQMRLPFKANSSEARAVHGALEEANAYREQAAWANLAELP